MMTLPDKKGKKKQRMAFTSGSMTPQKVRSNRGRGSFQAAAHFNTCGGTENKEESFNSSLSISD